MSTFSQRRSRVAGVAVGAFLATGGLAAVSAPAATAVPAATTVPATTTASPTTTAPTTVLPGSAQRRSPVTAVADTELPDPTTFTITEALTALDAGEYTSVELVEAFLARIETYEPYYNAFTQMNVDALDDAAASDERRTGSDDVRPLEGVPIVIKDSLDVAGIPTTSGWALTAPIAGGLALVPETDAPAVQRLRDAGAIILGKTNLPTLARSGNNANTSAYGPTYNALDQDWAPGGSSSGSATSVAGDFAVAGMAEETGGSIQNPASAQSLYGVKPTFGLVPNTGNFPLSGSTRDVLGPLTKTVEDAAVMLDVLAGYSPQDPKTEGAVVPEGGFTSQLSTTALEGKRIGLYGPGWRVGSNSELSPETAELYAQAVARLEEQGATVVEDPFAGSGFAELRAAGGETGIGPLNNYAVEQYLQRLGASAAVSSIAELNAWADANGFEDDTLIDAMLGDVSQEPDLSGFLARRDAYLTTFDQVMADHDLDALVFPQQVQEVGPIFGGTVAASTVSEINFAQVPGVVVPDGAYASGKPFNLLFLDTKWTEAELLGYAYDYAEAYGGRVVNRDLATTRGPSFVDVPAAYPFNDEISWLVENRITTGYEDGTFRPTDAVSRQAMAAFLHRFSTGERNAPACTTAPFVDVPVDHPFCGEIGWLVEQGIASGYPDGTFGATLPVSRQAMAAFVQRLVDGDVPAASCTGEPFADVPTSHPFCAEIAWMKAQSLSTGYVGGVYEPASAVSRQAMAAFLQRLDTVLAT
ncbi:amidase family protein [uncultured Cellulomonas sp.]|uniref:amidase family protein n=1 Tax=uncultured Cellulomonas sp. TaxID=189682 RepID=UPI00262D87AA|nr:amidase family protein [uncultured Cellulomonas sp.]